MNEMPSQFSDTTGQLITILPELLWFTLALAAMIIFYKPLHQLLLSLSNLKVGNVELSFVKQAMDNALELAKKSPEWNVQVTSEQKAIVLDRAHKHRAIIEGKKILWVDNEPQSHINETRMFRQLDADIVTARSTQEALETLSAERFDLVFSDIARSHKTSGLEMLSKLSTLDHLPAVIFYVGVINKKKGVPPGAFGITNRPDELLHLSIDALSRKQTH